MGAQKLIQFYQITPSGITPPSPVDVERKKNWFAEVQKTVEAPYKPKIVKITYEMFDPEVESQRRFFEGVVVAYYAIQQADGELPDSKVLKLYREQILDEMLGFNLNLISKTVRRRKSTTDFKSVQRWNAFLNTTKETIFDQAGYEFPDSDEFWQTEKQVGYDEAKRILTEGLVSRVKAKNTNL